MAEPNIVISSITLDKTSVKLGDSIIYEVCMTNVGGLGDIDLYIGFGYLVDTTKVQFIGSDYGDGYIHEVIGLVGAGEYLCPYGDIKVTQEVIDNVLAGKNVQFWAVGIPPGSADFKSVTIQTPPPPTKEGFAYLSYFSFNKINYGTFGDVITEAAPGDTVGIKCGMKNTGSVADTLYMIVIVDGIKVLDKQVYMNVNEYKVLYSSSWKMGNSPSVATVYIGHKEGTNWVEDKRQSFTLNVTGAIKQCIDYMNKIDCEANGCYWWSDNTCRDTQEGYQKKVTRFENIRMMSSGVIGDIFNVGQTVYVGSYLFDENNMTVDYASVELYVDDVLYDTTITDTRGYSQIPVTLDTVGSHVIKIQYNGDVDYQPASASVTLTLIDVTGYDIDVVLKDQNGNPVDGADIFIDGKSCTTFGGGTCIVRGVSAGTHGITVVKEGFSLTTSPDTINVVGNMQIDIGVTGSLPTSFVTVSVYDSRNNTFIEGALVDISGVQEFTNAKGIAILEVVNGIHTLKVTKNNYECISGCGNINITVDTTINVNLKSTMLYDLTFIVTSLKDKQSVDGVEIYIDGKSCITDTTGTCVIAGVPLGTYSLTVTKTGYSYIDIGQITVDSNKTINISVESMSLPPPVQNLKATPVEGGVRLDWDKYSEVVEGDFWIGTKCDYDETKTCFYFDHYHIYVDGVLVNKAHRDIWAELPIPDIENHVFNVKAVGTTGAESQDAIVEATALPPVACAIQNPLWPTLSDNPCLLDTNQLNTLKWIGIGMAGIVIFSAISPYIRATGHVVERIAKKK